MMLAAPTAFKSLGWRRTARATPDFLLFGGGAFFAACAVYALSSGVVGPGAHHLMLRVLAVRPSTETAVPVHSCCCLLASPVTQAAPRVQTLRTPCR